MGMIGIWLTGWAVCSVGSALVFAGWAWAAKRRLRGVPVPPPLTSVGRSR
jgi:hypothetical protein